MLLKCFVVLLISSNAALIAGKEINEVQKSQTEIRLNEPKIINGSIADWEGTRHQVSVRLKSRDWFFGGGHICGGSLIAPGVVLTAGHCMWNYDLERLRLPEEFSIVMGNLNRFIENNNTLVFDVIKISMLPDFNVTTFVDDIAIMFLDGEVSKNYTLAFPIPLNDVKNLKENTKCEVSGWGLTETGEYPMELMVVDVAVINDTFCRKSYGDSIIKDGMLCAGHIEGLKDSCLGDSGGPLNCDDKLVGIVSFGEGCAVPGLPGVYAKVAYYAEWIRKEAGLNGSSILKPLKLWGVLIMILSILKLNKFLYL